MTKKYFYNVPDHVTNSEAADLYRFMATGIIERTDYLDERNQIIFDILSHLVTQCGSVGTKGLIEYLTEFEIIEKVGGIEYVQKVFYDLEPISAQRICD